VADEQVNGTRDDKGRFQQGNTGNPAGRPPGARNKLGDQFVTDLYAHWQEHGKVALDGCLAESPAQYCRVVASLLPKQAELKIINPLDDVSDDDVAIALAALRAARAARPVGKVAGGRVVKAPVAEKSDRVH
jgi:hypothetical protein